MSKQFAEMINGVANAVGEGLQSAAAYSGKAAAKANAATAGFQSAQGAFNAGQAQIANDLGSGRIAQQYGYNSAQAANANAITQAMWNQAAGWNEDMFNRSMEFNAQQAELNRQFQERMDSTKYQRAIKDMEKAGLNPVLAVTGGGISTGGGSGSAASISAPSMSGASGAMASGGLLQGVSASEGMGSGQMEYMSGMLGLLSAAMAGISSATQAWTQMGLNDNQTKSVLSSIFDLWQDYTPAGNAYKFSKDPSSALNDYRNSKSGKALGKLYDNTMGKALNGAAGMYNRIFGSK